MRENAPMRRILLDDGVPVGVRTLVSGFQVEAVPEIGWAGLSSGDCFTSLAMTIGRHDPRSLAADNNDLDITRDLARRADDMCELHTIHKLPCARLRSEGLRTGWTAEGAPRVPIDL
jgi:hypothetical protein